MLMTSPDGKTVVDVHPGQVESMQNSGYKPANQTPAKKPAKKVQKVEDEDNGDT